MKMTEVARCSECRRDGTNGMGNDMDRCGKINRNKQTLIFFFGHVDHVAARTDRRNSRDFKGSDMFRISCGGHTAAFLLG